MIGKPNSEHAFNWFDDEDHVERHKCHLRPSF